MLLKLFLGHQKQLIGHQIHQLGESYAVITEAEVRVEQPAILTATANPENAVVGGAQMQELGILLLPGYGLSFPFASAAFASVRL